MIIETQYTYEKIWRETKEQHLLEIIAQELGDADPKGVLTYITETVKGGKSITVGSCRFRRKPQEGK